MSSQCFDHDRDVVFVTRFECGNILNLLVMVTLHPWIRRQIEKDTSGLVGSCHRVSWHERTILSVSLWRSLDRAYTMGSCRAHVVVARLPRRLGIATKCGVFALRGDWRAIMFGAPAAAGSPLIKLDRQRGISRE